MTSYLSNYFGNAALKDYFVSKATYGALHTTDPGVNGDLSTEFQGGGYQRQLAKWTSPSSKSTALVNTLIWTGLLAENLRYVAFWTAAENGNLLIRVPLPALVSIPASGQFKALPSDIAIIL